MDHARCRLPTEPRHSQRINGDVRRHPWLDRLAGDFSIEQVEDHGHIQPTLIGPDVGAHGYAMDFQYNGKLRCAELLLREDGSVN